MIEKPIAKKQPFKITQHGQERIDDYHWLRDKNWKKFIEGDLTFSDSQVEEYIKKENAYTDSMMSEHSGLQKELYQELLSRINENDETCPYKIGNFLYFQRTQEGKDYPILCRKTIGENQEVEVFFDINERAAAHKLYIHGATCTSPDNKYFAFSFNLTGSLQKTLKVYDFVNKRDLEWQVENTTGSFFWADEQHLLFIERDDSSRGKKIYKFNIHQGPKSKNLVFEKPAELDDMFMFMGQTTDKKAGCVYMASGSRNVVYITTDYINFEHLVTGEENVEYSIDHYGHQFFIRCNENHCSNFKILCCDERDLSREAWKEFLSEDKKFYVSEMHAYRNRLVIKGRANDLAKDEIHLIDISNKNRQVVQMKDPCFDLRIIGADDSESETIQLYYASPIQPAQTLELNLEDTSIKVLKTKEVPGFDSSQYVLERQFAKAHDGEEVPVTVVYKKGLSLNGESPAFVYAYGSYGNSMPSYFSSNVFSLVDRGFVYAIAHIRGGAEKGFDWYLNGKMKNKKNTFKDYISVCEHLIDRKYTFKGGIVANGASAGGLLMGVVSNWRPDLFRAIVAEVAFVDMINTISDESLPLTPPEWEEWGNPIKNKDDFEYMMSYSPYDNVSEQDYPPTLYVSGISDEQVTYWEPTKMVAKLRAHKTDKNPLLLKMKMHAGHAGASKRYEWIEDEAFIYTFILQMT